MHLLPFAENCMVHYLWFVPYHTRALQYPRHFHLVVDCPQYPEKNCIREKDLLINIRLDSHLNQWQDCLQEDGDIDLSPFRKSNSKRPDPPWKRFLQHHYRKIVETSGSLIERLLPKHIHATNAAGFELKVILFVLALSFDRFLRVAT